MEVAHKAEPLTIKEQAQHLFRIEGEKIGQLLEAYDIQPEKFEAVAEYAIKMKANNPRMKNERIVRKTVAYFHLKLKPIQDGSSN